MRVLLTDPNDQLFRSEHDRLWKSLVAFCGDADIAAEAEAEAFSQALRRGDSLIDPRAWLWRTAFRIAGGLLAERRQAAGREISSADLELPAAPDPATAAELADFVDLLSGLSEQQRTIVILRYAAGFPAGEIADLLGTTPGTVRVQLHRAHTALREQMGSQ